MIIPFSPYSPCSTKETFNKLLVISTRLVIIWNLKIEGNLQNNDILFSKDLCEDGTALSERTNYTLWNQVECWKNYHMSSVKYSLVIKVRLLIYLANHF